MKKGRKEKRGKKGEKYQKRKNKKRKKRKEKKKKKKKEKKKKNIEKRKEKEEEQMFGRIAHYRTATMLRMTRNIAPLPCCGCTCSAGHPSRCSPPLFHNHVRVNSVLAARTACLASRVACVRAWSWLSHPRPPDRSQHGCSVGVDRDPPV